MPKHHEGQAGIVHRQHVEGIEAEDEADRADHARRDRARDAEFENQAEHPDDHQDECRHSDR